jgi:hypothetical protein
MKNPYTCLLVLGTLSAGPGLSSGAHAQAADEVLALRAESQLASLSAAMPDRQTGAANPAPLDTGSVYVIKKAVGLQADSILYLLERASDRAQALVEIKDRGPAPRGVAANTVGMANALGAQLLLSDAGDEVTLPKAPPARPRRRAAVR